MLMYAIARRHTSAVSSGYIRAHALDQPGSGIFVNGISSGNSNARVNSYASESYCAPCAYVEGFEAGAAFKGSGSPLRNAVGVPGASSEPTKKLRHFAQLPVGVAQTEDLSSVESDGTAYVAPWTAGRTGTVPEIKAESREYGKTGMKETNGYVVRTDVSNDESDEITEYVSRERKKERDTARCGVSVSPVCVPSGSGCVCRKGNGPYVFSAGCRDVPAVYRNDCTAVYGGDRGEGVVFPGYGIPCSFLTDVKVPEGTVCGCGGGDVSAAAECSVGYGFENWDCGCGVDCGYGCTGEDVSFSLSLSLIGCIEGDCVCKDPVPKRKD